MSNVMLDFIPNFEQSERIFQPEARNRELALSVRRRLGSVGAPGSIGFGFCPKLMRIYVIPGDG